LLLSDLQVYKVLQKLIRAKIEIVTVTSNMHVFLQGSYDC